MSDEEKIKSLAIVVSDVYKDVAQRTAIAIGKTLGNVFETVLLPIDHYADIAKKNMMVFFNKLEQEHPDNLIAAPPNVTIPILQKLIYLEEENLVEYYTELLKCCCTRDKQKKVLPSYAVALSSLSPDEVKLINYLHTVGYPSDIGTPIPGFPSLEILDIDEARKSSQVYNNYFVDLHHKIDNLDFPENMEIYIANLVSLGILTLVTYQEIPFTVPGSLTNCSGEHLMKTSELKEIQLKIEHEENHKMKTLHRAFGFSPFAESLLFLCTGTKGID